MKERRLKMYYLLSVISLIWLSACELEKTISWDIPYNGPGLFVSALFTSGEPMSLSLYETLHPLAEPQDTPYVDGALILLFEDGIQVDTLWPVRSGYYQSSYHPKTGPAYHLEIYASGFEPVKTAPEHVPEALALHDLHLMEAPNAGGGRLLEVEVEERPAVPDYYQFRVEASWDEQQYQRAGQFYISPNLDLLCSFAREGIVEDKCLDTATATSRTALMEVGTRRLVIHDDGTMTNLPYRLYRVELRTITEAYFQYFAALEAYLDKKDNPFLAPVTSWTNIEGGFGVFAAYARVEKEVSP